MIFQQARLDALLEEAAIDMVTMGAVNVATLNALDAEGYELSNLEDDIALVLAKH